MALLNQRFGWKGIDGIGQKPIKIYLEDSDKFDPKPAHPFGHYYSDATDEYFEFFRSLTDTEPFNNVLEVVGHEYAHAIFHQKTGISFQLTNLCKEVQALDEGIADIHGIYLKNKILQTPPQNFNWLFQEQIENPAEDLSNPKSFGYPDTYLGQFYPNTCYEGFDTHPASSVVVKWFQLLAEGFQGNAYNDLGYGYSNLTGIGVEKAIQIVWDAIPSIKIYSDYPAFKAFTLQAAEKLYGLHSTEYLAVQNAWCAVGVCDNNPAAFSMYPANATGNVNPWPAVKINLTWKNSGVTKWLVQTSTQYDFSENVQETDADNFTMVVDPNGLLTYSASVDAYYHPGEKVCARAKIIEADPNFCKGLNPLCAFYQQFGPTHAFTLKDLQVKFWPYNSLSMVVNPWDKPELRWRSIDGADRYRIQVATDNVFNNLVYDEVVVHTGNFTESTEINATLEMGKDFFVRVRAERLDFVKINKNYGKWSDTFKLHTAIPQTSILQALNQKANDPPQTVSSLGFVIGWYVYPGATSYVVQVATDDAFLNVIRSQTVAGNLNGINFSLPTVANLTNLFVRVLPQRGNAFGFGNNTWRVKTNENYGVPAMENPANGTNFPFRNFLSVFQWKGGTLNANLVDHFEVWVTEKTFGLTSIFKTQGKAFDFPIQDPFMFDDKAGIQVRVVAVGALGAKSGFSAPFDYNICPDNPEIIFPADLISKVDAFQDFHVEWHDSFWFDPGSEYMVTIRDAMTDAPVAGFNNKLTTATSMLVPAGTLTNGKNYTVSVKNSSTCAGIILPANIFSAVGVGGSNQPQPTKLVNFTIDLQGFRNNQNGLAWETSDYILGFEFIDPDGNLLALVDPNGNQITQLLVDSENSGVILSASNKPEGQYKLRLKMLNIFNPLLYYPFDQPRFSVFLNGDPVVNPHVITVNFADPNSLFNEWKVGFQFADIILNVK
ncbi:M4 family metallopeptidase [Dyadobacter sp.]|uniref:M4 family metallopeptidase n=1 Tax=Dyadobacter sp. TaxID=1914288 RepID=UPI0025B88299|nr:M4 family metallopeptidase [Dyadobacter sp.]